MIWNLEERNEFQIQNSTFLIVQRPSDRPAARSCDALDDAPRVGRDDVVAPALDRLHVEERGADANRHRARAGGPGSPPPRGRAPPPGPRGGRGAAGGRVFSAGWRGRPKAPRPGPSPPSAWTESRVWT